MTKFWRSYTTKRLKLCHSKGFLNLWEFATNSLLTDAEQFEVHSLKKDGNNKKSQKERW